LGGGDVGLGHEQLEAALAEDLQRALQGQDGWKWRGRLGDGLRILSVSQGSMPRPKV